jgi:hypothetical protein
LHFSDILGHQHVALLGSGEGESCIDGGALVCDEYEASIAFHSCAAVSFAATSANTSLDREARRNPRPIGQTCTILHPRGSAPWPAILQK